LEADLVEIVLPDVDVETVAPKVRDPFQGNRTARLETLDPVRARAQRRLERGGGNIALVAVLVAPLPPVLGQHRELADDQRQLAIAGRIECEPPLALPGG